MLFTFLLFFTVFSSLSFFLNFFAFFSFLRFQISRCLNFYCVAEYFVIFLLLKILFRKNLPTFIFTIIFIYLLYLIVLISFPFLFESFMIFCSFTFFRFSCLHWFHHYYLLNNIVTLISREIGLTLEENTKFCACILFAFLSVFSAFSDFLLILFRFNSLFSFDFVSFLFLFPDFHLI